MDARLEADLKRCLGMISTRWPRQNKAMDVKTKFIYDAKYLDDCLQKIEEEGVDKEYTLHRWYNYHTSTYCEYIFCDYGAVHDKNERNFYVDIYIDGIAFDVKLTVYPQELSDKPYDLKTRNGKDDMIRWMYKNQSQGNRKQMDNRLYVVCDGDSAAKNLAMKCDFDTLRKRIKAYMDFIKEHGINKLDITDNGTVHSLYTDLIYIKY